MMKPTPEFQKKRLALVRYALAALLAAASVSASCGGKGAADGNAANGAAGSGAASGASSASAGSSGTPAWIADAGAGTSVHTTYPCIGCASFPSLGSPECAASALAAPTLAYPPDGVLLPPNMNVLEVQFIPNSDATLFEVDFVSQNTEVTVETPCVSVPDVRGGASRGCGLTLPQAAWDDIANNNREAEPMKVTVRATRQDLSCAATSANSSRIAFAKEDLAGGIYYWQSATYGGVGGKTGGIYSHDFGSLDPTPTPFYTSDATGTCVGCHTVSRDGVRMSLETDDPDADDEMGDVHSQLMDIETRTALGGKGISPGFQTFTHDHLKLVASTFKAGGMAMMPGMGMMPGKGGGTPDLSWDVFDETATLTSAADVGGGLAATQPDLASDDATMVFVVPQAGSISTAGDHHFMSGALYTSSFDSATLSFGTPSVLLSPQGTQNFYYPSFSPNQTFVLFNAAPDGDSFFNRKARVQLLHYPVAGSSPIDLPALNTAPSGAGDPDKLTNSWPKWSPFVQSYRGHKLLWVTFSSNRDYGLHLVNQGFDNCYPPESPDYDQPQPLSKQGVTYESCAQPQIWMAAVIVDEDGSIDGIDRSFPAFWLPFQDVTAHNHTAQWVEKVVTTPPPPDAGSPPDGGAACMPSGGSCTSARCCSDSVCCGDQCLPSCLR